jgi:AcrR family transcriptional regulator
MPKKPGPNKENLESSHRAFLDAGREEFIKYGYVKSSTDRIVDSAGMARGSLYYHFKNKHGLFLAVYEEVCHEIREKIKTQTSSIKDPWNAFLEGCILYIDYCIKPQTRKILFDGYSVLSYEERMTVMEKTLIGTMQKAIKNLIELGYFKQQDYRSIAIIIFGMISEAGHLISTKSKNQQAEKDRFKKTFLWLMKKANN